MKVTKQWFIFLGLLSSINFNSYFGLLTFEVTTQVGMPYSYYDETIAA